MSQNNSSSSIKVEIWSDVMCPFCYIGKRKFESALEQFSHKNLIEVEWKSFQLDPTLPAEPVGSQTDYLIKKKGFQAEQIPSMLQRVNAMAQEVGLTYNLEQSIMVNSGKAHHLIQYAKTQKLGDEMEERLFQAYFTEGLNVGDDTVLLKLATDIGLEEKKTVEALAQNVYSQMAERDYIEAAEIGVTGVPFFVFDRKYAISGAQDVSVFTNTLNQLLSEKNSSN